MYVRYSRFEVGKDRQRDIKDVTSERKVGDKCETTINLYRLQRILQQISHTDGIDVTVVAYNTDATASVVHVGYFRPLIGLWIVVCTTTEAFCTIEATNDVNSTCLT